VRFCEVLTPSIAVKPTMPSEPMTPISALLPSCMTETVEVIPLVMK